MMKGIPTATNLCSGIAYLSRITSNEACNYFKMVVWYSGLSHKSVWFSANKHFMTTEVNFHFLRNE